MYIVYISTTYNNTIIITDILFYTKWNWRWKLFCEIYKYLNIPYTRYTVHFAYNNNRMYIVLQTVLELKTCRHSITDVFFSNLQINIDGIRSYF